MITPIRNTGEDCNNEFKFLKGTKMKPKPVKPEPGQESVWDYPRPPKLERCNNCIRVIFAGVDIANTTNAFRVLETSHPPVYYIPPEEIHMRYLISEEGRSWCEWKGQGRYYGLKVGDRYVSRAAWYYPEPVERFKAIKNYIAFYAGKVDACYVENEQVFPQPGRFYGGWITKNVVGPFKGGPGTEGW